MRSLVLLLAAPLLAQTTVKPDQLRPAAPEAPKPVLLAFSAKGFTPVTLGPGISAVPTGAGYTIDVAPVAPAPPPRLTLAPAILNPDGTVTVPASFLIFRNGLLQLTDFDYTVAGGRLSPKLQWGPEDTIVLASFQ